MDQIKFNKIKKLLEKGYTYNSIVETVGCSKSTIRDVKNIMNSGTSAKADSQNSKGYCPSDRKRPPSHLKKERKKNINTGIEKRDKRQESLLTYAQIIFLGDMYSTFESQRSVYLNKGEREFFRTIINELNDIKKRIY